MTEVINVKKKSGVIEEYNPDKIHAFLDYVCEGISNVSISDIEMKSRLFVADGITTVDINASLVNAAEGLISIETPNYDLVAGRIIISDIRKQVYGGIHPWSLLDIIKKNVSMGVYDPAILDNYTEEDINTIDSFIHHERDMNISIAGAREWVKKYLCRHRGDNIFYESPQIAYVLISMCLFMEDKEEGRLDNIKTMYDMFSTGFWNIPTPILAGMRTPTRSFASCVLIEAGDSINSISAVETTAKRFATLKAGLGISTARLRSRGALIRNGDAINTGGLYHAQSIESSTLSVSQGGIRKGSITFSWLSWHYDFEEMINFRNTAKPQEESMQHSDHSFAINGYIYQRALKGQDIYLFDPADTPELLDAFYSSDVEKFKELYELSIGKEGVRQRRMAASTWISLLIGQRMSTGRIYIQNIDNCNSHSPFLEEVAPVRMSNLCQEIMQHTEPLETLEFQDVDGNRVYTMEGLIALCNLGGINVARYQELTRAGVGISELERMIQVAVRGMDNLLDYQYYPVDPAKKHNEMYRPLGIGLTGLAEWLARKGFTYSNCYEELDTLVEEISFMITKASCLLAVERGTPAGYMNTKWSKGILPIDTYKKNVDKITPNNPKKDWNTIREMLTTTGIRNTTLMAIMPAETSAKVSGRGTTNGVEPIRSLISYKGGKDTKSKFVAPHCDTVADQYDMVWTWTSTRGLIDTYAVIQKYVDQGISVNTYYNKSNFPGGMIPGSTVLEDLIYAYKMGIKTVYYNNNNDSLSSDINIDKRSTPSPKSNSEEEDYCESCSI